MKRGDDTQGIESIGESSDIEIIENPEELQKIRN